MTGNDETGGTSPCLARQLVGGHVVDPDVWRDVTRFRKAERARLYACRRKMPQAAQAEQAERVADVLDCLIPDPTGRVIAGYWPIRGEMDLRRWLARMHGADAQPVLPVVTDRGQPVVFHAWEPGARMTRGIWNILVPAAPRPLTPDIVVVPLLGVDDACYRLGNGGGYYDMTLAALSPRPLVIGVGQDFCTIPTIFPQPWDVPMDHVLLGDGTRRDRMG